MPAENVQGMQEGYNHNQKRGALVECGDPKSHLQYFGKLASLTLLSSVNICSVVMLEKLGWKCKTVEQSICLAPACCATQQETACFPTYMLNMQYLSSYLSSCPRSKILNPGEGQGGQGQNMSIIPQVSGTLSCLLHFPQTLEYTKQSLWLLLMVMVYKVTILQMKAGTCSSWRRKKLSYLSAESFLFS